MWARSWPMARESRHSSVTNGPEVGARLARQGQLPPEPPFPEPTEE